MGFLLSLLLSQLHYALNIPRAGWLNNSAAVIVVGLFVVVVVVVVVGVVVADCLFACLK